MNPRAQDGAVALRLERLSKHFGGLTVLSEVGLDVERGRVHGLIGPNGAGKTTLINIATGYYQPDAGRVSILGADVTATGPDRRANLGLARTFQGARPFSRLDVRTNLRLAIEQRRRHGGEARGRQAVREEVERTLEESGLAPHAGTLCAHLTYGQCKQVEIARALAFARLALLLDEPTAGLSDPEIERCLKLVARHRERLAILLIEHNMDVVMSLCDQVTVIDAGRHLATGTPAEVARDPAVIAAYLGSAYD